jgi:hypothetical protein
MVLFDVSLPRRKQDDDAAAESNAILAISKALSALPDPEARMRVLRWANERFNAPAEIAGEAPLAARTAAADPMLSLDGLLAFFEPTLALARPEAHDAPRPIERDDEHETIADLFDQPIHRCKTELRVVRKETPDPAPDPAPLALDDLHDLYDEAPLSAHRAELEAAITDLYEQPVEQEHAEAIDEPMGDLYDAPANQQHVELDERAAMLFEDLVEEPIDDPLEAVEPAAACEDQSLDTLVADLASALKSLTLQLQDVSA